MRRIGYILVGVAAATMIGFVAGAIATNWYSEHAAKSDDDINFVVKVFLLLWPLLSFFGGYIGHRLYKRNLTLPSSEPPPA